MLKADHFEFEYEDNDRGDSYYVTIDFIDIGEENLTIFRSAGY